MKLALVLILSLLIPVESQNTADDLPDLTMSEPLLSQEELDSLNQLRKDVVKSLETLASKMEADEAKSDAEYLLVTALEHMQNKRYNLENVDDRFDQISRLQETLDQFFSDREVMNVGRGKATAEDKGKLKDFLQNVPPNFQKRFEPFEKYLSDDD